MFTIEMNSKYGTVDTSQFTGIGFELRIDRYHFTQNETITLNIEAPILLMVINWQHALQLTLQPQAAMIFQQHQYNLFHWQAVVIDIECSAEKTHEIIYLSFDKHLLRTYSRHCTKLVALLTAAEQKQSASMFETAQFLSLDMTTAVNKILHFTCERVLASFFYQAMVQQLLALMMIQISVDKERRVFSEYEISATRKVHAIILSDFEMFHTVNQLARKVGLAENKLQEVFKHLYGQTVAAFSRAARLEKGKQLLEETTHPLRVICEMVGYPDASNFSVAFRKQYGYWPGKIQKQRR